MNLTTERCLIRPFTEDDWQNVYAYTSDPVVMKYMPEGVFSKEEARDFVKNNRLETAKNFAVLLKEVIHASGISCFIPTLVSTHMKLAGSSILHIKTKALLLKRRMRSYIMVFTQ